MFALEAINIIGLIIALIGFMWCLGPLRTLSSPEQLSEGWQQLYYSSNVSFAISGFLTDRILVSCVIEPIRLLLNYALPDLAL